MCEFQFFYGLNLSQLLFAISDNLSKTLQKESMSALSDRNLAELTVQTYQKMRSDEEPELFFKTASKEALDYPFINKAVSPRKRKRLNYGSLDKYFQVKNIAIMQTHIVPLLGKNTSCNNILKIWTSYHQLKIVSINLLSQHFSKWSSCC